MSFDSEKGLQTLQKSKKKSQKSSIENLSQISEENICNIKPSLQQLQQNQQQQQQNIKNQTNNKQKIKNKLSLNIEVNINTSITSQSQSISPIPPNISDFQSNQDEILKELDIQTPQNQTFTEQINQQKLQDLNLRNSFFTDIENVKNFVRLNQRSNTINNSIQNAPIRSLKKENSYFQQKNSNQSPSKTPKSSKNEKKQKLQEIQNKKFDINYQQEQLNIFVQQMEQNQNNQQLQFNIFTTQDFDNIEIPIERSMTNIDNFQYQHEPKFFETPTQSGITSPYCVSPRSHQISLVIEKENQKFFKSQKKDVEPIKDIQKQNQVNQEKTPKNVSLNLNQKSFQLKKSPRNKYTQKSPLNQKLLKNKNSNFLSTNLKENKNYKEKQQRQQFKFLGKTQIQNKTDQNNNSIRQTTEISTLPGTPNQKPLSIINLIKKDSIDQSPKNMDQNTQINENFQKKMIEKKRASILNQIPKLNQIKFTKDNISSPQVSKRNYEIDKQTNQRFSFIKDQIEIEQNCSQTYQKPTNIKSNFQSQNKTTKNKQNQKTINFQQDLKNESPTKIQSSLLKNQQQKKKNQRNSVRFSEQNLFLLQETKEIEESLNKYYQGYQQVDECSDDCEDDISQDDGFEHQIGKYGYDEEDLLGEGTFSKVYKGYNMKTGDVYAIKKIDKKIFQSQKLRDLLKTEILAMKDLSDVNVIKMYDVIKTKHHVHMILEYCSDGDLDAYILKHGGLSGRIKEDQAIIILNQIIQGLKDLIFHGYLHRDIKPANTLVKGKYFKLADFGMATKIDTRNNSYLNDQIGSPLYMAPQILESSPYTIKSDIWSVGIVFYQMLFGKTPWPARDIQSLKENIKYQPLKFPYDIPIGVETKNFITGCLQINEDLRLNWDQVFNHSIFKNRGELDHLIKFDQQAKTIIREIQETVQLKHLSLKDIFDNFDHKKLGYLNLQEFYKLLNSIDMKVTYYEAKYIFEALYKIDKQTNSKYVCYDDVKQLLLYYDFVNLDDPASHILADIRQIFQVNKYDLDAVFGIYDKQKGGALKIVEFQNMLQSFLPGLKEREIKLCFNNLDKLNQGEVTYEQFQQKIKYGIIGLDNNYNPYEEKAKKILNYLKNIIKSLNIQIMDLVQKFDKKRNLKLQYHEFQNLIKQIDNQLPQTDIKAIFSFINKDGQNSISYKQIQQHLQK